MTVVSAAFVLVFLSDRIWNTPDLVRAAVLGGGVVACLTMQVFWVYRWVLGQRSMTELALAIRRVERSLGDKVLGAVEIAEGRAPHSEDSPELCRAALAQVGRQVAGFDVERAVRRQRLIFASRCLFINAVIAMALLLAFPKASANAMLRLLKPFDGPPRFQFVELGGLPESMIVAQGEPSRLDIEVRYSSFLRPTRVIASVGGLRAVAEVVQGKATIEIPALTTPSAMVVELGDAHQTVAMRPEFRPFIRSAEAKVILPEYLGRNKAEAVEIKGSGFHVLSGSRVVLTAKANRALDRVSLPSGSVARVGDLRGEEVELAPFQVGDVEEVSLELTDENGLSSKAPWTLMIRGKQDQGPRVEFVDLPLESAILETDIVSLKVDARDDFGIRNVGVKWKLIGSGQEIPDGTNDAFHAETGLTSERSISETFLFSPLVLEIPTDSTVEIHAYASDLAPDRSPSESLVHRIYVIDLVSHAEWLRGNMESLFRELEEVTRGQESVVMETDRLAALGRDRMFEDRTGEEAGQLAEEQERIARELSEMVREGAGNLREALRNPTFTEEALGKWADILGKMKETSDSSMKEASNFLNEAGESQDRASSLGQAQESATEALNELSQLQGKVNDGLDELEALTLAQRLKKLAESQDLLVKRLVQVVTEVIGLEETGLTEPQRKFETHVASDHLEQTKLAEVIQGEISRFFERTRKEAYGQVSREMDELKMPQALKEVSHSVNQNLVMKSVEDMNSWAGRFRGWSDLLKPEEEDKSEGGGEGQGQGFSQEELMKLMLAFMRLRSSQQDVRTNTDLLDQEGPDAENRTSRTVKLVTEQVDLTDRLDALRSANPVDVLDPVILEARSSMNESEKELSEGHLKHAHDQPQKDSLLLLTDIINLINEQSQNAAQQQQSGRSESMEMLLEMVEQGQGRPSMSVPSGATPGARAAAGQKGGNPGRTETSGNVAGREAASRRERSGTGGSQSVPVEFRNVMEGYYKVLDGLGKGGR